MDTREITITMQQLRSLIIGVKVWNTEAFALLTDTGRARLVTAQNIAEKLTRRINWELSEEYENG